MWGIPHHDPESTTRENGDRIAGSTGRDWRGLYEFKTRFGGDIMTYPEPLEKPYRPLLASMARRIYRTRGE
jgi:lipid II:glycine glycyltransferase (peptidoglycan interpeptide bridge formation enzyme)